MHPAFPRPELLLVCCYDLDLQVILVVPEEGLLLKEPCPANFAGLAQKVVADGDAAHELILHGDEPSCSCIITICQQL